MYSSYFAMIYTICAMSGNIGRLLDYPICIRFADVEVVRPGSGLILLILLHAALTIQIPLAYRD